MRRAFLGADIEMWKEFNTVFEMAVPALEAQSFVSEDPSTANGNGSSSTLMALNHNTLMKDLERLNDLLMIARNMLATTTRAQNLAGDSQIDQQVLKLIDVCVRVTARGYDGDAGSRSETQWANVVGSCKSHLSFKSPTRKACHCISEVYIVHGRCRWLIFLQTRNSSSPACNFSTISSCATRSASSSFG